MKNYHFTKTKYDFIRCKLPICFYILKFDTLYILNDKLSRNYDFNKEEFLKLFNYINIIIYN